MSKTTKQLIAISIIPQYFIVKWLAQYPDIIETYYSNGFYQYSSKLFRYVFGLFPFSIGDLLYLFAIIYGVRWFIKNRKRIIKDTKEWLVDIISVLSILYFAFHLLWGMNYYRQPLHENLGINAEYTTEQLVSVTKMLIEKSNEIHSTIVNNDSLKVEIPYEENNILNLVSSGFENLKQDFPDLEYHPKSLKKSLFSYPLAYSGVGGYLNPITNEAQINTIIPTFKYPTTASHEIAHQLGYAAENEAHFIGYLATMNHDNKHFNYSGYTLGLRHCLNEVYMRDEVLYKELVETVNPGILKNYKEVREFQEAHNSPLVPFFNKFFNGFLKANNQDKGMESYSYVVALLVNYFESNNI